MAREAEGGTGRGSGAGPDASSAGDLRLTVDLIPAAVWSARPDGSADFFNQHYLDYVGLPLEEVQGWGWTQVIHPDDLPRLLESWSALATSGQSGEAEARIRRHDGEYRWFLFRTTPHRDERGKVLKWYGLNTDIEDRRQMEERLRRSEAFLAEGQHLARMGNLSWRVATGEITWSEPLYRIFEFEPGSVVTLERIGTRVPPEDVPMLMDMVARAGRGELDFEYQHRIVFPDGRTKHLHLIAHRAGDREEVEYLGAVLDVTQRRLSEDTLEAVRSELAHLTRIMSLGALTASIAHEVNQPLSGIVTNAGTCLRMLSADPPTSRSRRKPPAGPSAMATAPPTSSRACARSSAARPPPTAESTSTRRRARCSPFSPATCSEAGLFSPPTSPTGSRRSAGTGSSSSRSS